MNQQQLGFEYMADQRWPLDIRIYSDEVKAYTNHLGQQWMYIGFLAIPQPRYFEARELLREHRRNVNYHDELHFTSLRNYSYAHIHNEKTLLAKRWIQEVINDTQETFYFYLLGINLTNIQEKAFGEKKKEQRLNIYNRFYRSSLIYLVKRFFPHKKVRIAAIYHDNENSLEQHDRFDWHSIKVIGKNENNISFLCNEITFVDSDHNKERRYPDASHFIQLCDILTGGITQLLDDRNSKDGCQEIALLLTPAVETLVTGNSFSHYAKRLAISFFPSKHLSMKELNDPDKRRTSIFYKSRRLLMLERIRGQQPLPF